MARIGWFLISLIGVALASQANPDSLGKRKLRITGGTPTTIKKHPYQAAIIRNGNVIGSGVIVGKRFVLTTGYLAESYTFQVRVGSTRSTEGGQVLNATKKTLHPKYNYNTYDVALIKLSEDIEYGKYAKPIRLASKEGRNTTVAVLTGYGTERVSMKLHGTSSGSLQRGTQYVIDRATCQIQYNGFLKLDESMSCAYSKNVCACFEDGGDPLVQKNKLLGLNLGVVVCCFPDMAQLYNNVPAFRKWVVKEMKKEGFREVEEVGHYYKHKKLE